MNEEFYFTITTNSSFGYKNINLRNVSTNEVMSAIIVEEVKNDFPHDGVLAELTANGRPCVALWDFNTGLCYRRRGYGKRILEYVLQLYSNKNMVLVAKPGRGIELGALIKLYQSVGFEVSTMFKDRAIMKKVNIQ